MPFVYVSGYRPEITIFRLDTAGGTLAPAGKRDERRTGSVVPGSGPGCEVSVRGQRNRPRAGAIVCGESGDRRTDADKRRALDGKHHGASVHGQNGPVAAGCELRRSEAGDDCVDSDRRRRPAWRGGRHAGVRPGNDGPSNQGGSRQSLRVRALKGGPAVAQLVFDPASGRMKPNVPPQVAAAAGAGPRHLDFHPNGRFAYVINELDLTMAAFVYDAKTGLLTQLQVLPTLPAAADKVGASCADVHVHQSGRFLYGSNRGHNSIVIYRLGDDGRMTLVGHESRGINRPRNFTIDPTGTLMLVANQDSASVTIFRIDQNKGTLEPVGAPTPAGEIRRSSAS